jgi:hypothetical protein
VASVVSLKYNNWCHLDLLHSSFVHFKTLYAKGETHTLSLVGTEVFVQFLTANMSSVWHESPSSSWKDEVKTVDLEACTPRTLQQVSV